MLKSDEKETIHKEKRNGLHGKEWFQIWTLKSEIEKRLRVRFKDVTCVFSVYTVHSKQYTHHQVSNRLLIQVTSKVSPITLMPSVSAPEELSSAEVVTSSSLAAPPAAPGSAAICPETQAVHFSPGSPQHMPAAHCSEKDYLLGAPALLSSPGNFEAPLGSHTEPQTHTWEQSPRSPGPAWRRAGYLNPPGQQLGTGAGPFPPKNLLR